MAVRVRRSAAKILVMASGAAFMLLPFASSAGAQPVCPVGMYWDTVTLTCVWADVYVNPPNPVLGPVGPVGAGGVIGPVGPGPVGPGPVGPGPVGPGRR